MVIMFLEDAERQRVRALLSLVEQGQTADTKIGAKLMQRLKEVYGVA